MIKPVNFEPSQHFGDNPTNTLPVDHWLIQRFGNYQPDGHTGIDYPCPAGTPVKAVTAGTVLHVGWFGGTYADNPYWIAPGFAGYCYVVDHGDFVGIYAHCMDGGSRVKVGQRVAEGQVLGPSGNTGGSTGDHLHFETLPDGWVVNSRMYGRINPTTILAKVTPQGTTTKPATGGLTVADINSITKQLNEIQKALEPINTSSGEVSLRQFIADGTRAAQAAEKNTAPINTSSGQQSLRDFIAKGTRAAQRVEARMGALEAVMAKAVETPGADLATLTAAAAAGAEKALSNLRIVNSEEG